LTILQRRTLRVRIVLRGKATVNWYIWDDKLSHDAFFLVKCGFVFSVQILSAPVR